MPRIRMRANDPPLNCLAETETGSLVVHAGAVFKWVNGASPLLSFAFVRAQLEIFGFARTGFETLACFLG